MGVANKTAPKKPSKHTRRHGPSIGQRQGTDLDEIVEHEVGHPWRRAVHGPADEAAQPVGGLREQRLLDGPLLPRRHLPHLPRRRRHAAGHHHHPRHPVPALHGGQPVRHEPAVADPDHVVAVDAEEPHGLGGAPGLERDGAERRGGSGVRAEEEEVGRVDVEVARQRREVARPRPLGVTAEAVEEEQRRLGGRRRGAPDADRGGVGAREAEVDGADAEAGEEVEGQRGVAEGGEAEPHEEDEQPEEQQRQREQREERRGGGGGMPLLHGADTRCTVRAHDEQRPRGVWVSRGREDDGLPLLLIAGSLASQKNGYGSMDQLARPRSIYN
jgi:hypothetical protein